ncbi:MAG: murein transglycosylase A [Acetobacteraceae bacterium]
MRGVAGPAALIALGLSLAGCAVPPPGQPHAMTLEPVRVASLPGFASDQLARGFIAFQNSCSELLTLPADQRLGGAGLAQSLGGTAGQWRSTCTAARAVSPTDEAAVRTFLERNLVAYRVSADTNATVQFSGYFEPVVAGSLHETAHFDIALYGRPHDLVQADLGNFSPALTGHLVAGRVRDGRLVPYFTRAEIAAGALQGRHLEVAWLADPVDAFVLDIEGAGRIRLPDGDVVRVGYAGENGQPYVPIGRILTERDAIPKNAVTLSAIVAWLKAHPEQAQAVMDENPSYVFLRILHGIPSDLGPPGALGVPLAPSRALAVDRNYIPLGAPVWIATTEPGSDKPLQRLMVAEDIGGSMATPLAADVFFGSGPAAGQAAGAMDQPGRAWLLLPRPPA